MILNILSEYRVIVTKYTISQINNAVHTIKEIGGSKVKFIILYGSVAANTQTNDSDIDITVFYDTDERNQFQFRIKVLG